MKKNYTILIVIALTVFVAFASAQVLHLASEIEPGTFPVGDFGFQGNVEVSKNGEVFVNVKNSDANGKDYALVSAGALGGIGAGKFSIYDKTLGVSRLVVDSNGNVGIGTTSPAQKLDVAGSVRASGTICDANGCIQNRDCRPVNGYAGDACAPGNECDMSTGECVPIPVPDELTLSWSDAVTGSSNVGDWTYPQPFGFSFTPPQGFRITAVDIDVGSVAVSGGVTAQIRLDEGGSPGTYLVSNSQSVGFKSGTTTWAFPETELDGVKHWVYFSLNSGAEANINHVTDNSEMASARCTVNSKSGCPLTDDLNMAGVDFKVRVR